MHFRTTSARFTDGDPKSNALRAAEKIRGDFADFPASLIVFFSATDYQPAALAAAMQGAFPGVKTIGCTSAGESLDGKLLNATVVAMAYDAEVFEYCEIAAVVEDAHTPDRAGVFGSADAALAHLGRNLCQDLLELNFREYVGLILIDRISSISEAILERVGELTDVIFMGGVSGDDYKFVNGQTVFFEGGAYQNAAVLALWKPRRGFELLKTQAVELTDRQKLIVTKADEQNRLALEFNGEPAAKAYADAIGSTPETIGLPEYDEYPLALAVDGEPFMRVVSRQTENQGLEILAGVREGMRFTIAHSADIINTTSKALADKRAEMGPIAAILHINCVSRHNNLKARGQADEFAALFQGVPDIAFASYGEIYVGIIAMTSTMIIFK